MFDHKENIKAKAKLISKYGFSQETIIGFEKAVQISSNIKKMNEDDEDLLTLLILLRKDFLDDICNTLNSLEDRPIQTVINEINEWNNKIVGFLREKNKFPDIDLNGLIIAIGECKKMTLNYCAIAAQQEIENAKWTESPSCMKNSK